MSIKKLFSRIPLPRIVREHPWISIIYVGAVIAISLGIFLFALEATLPSVEEIDSRSVEMSTKIMDRTGQTSLYELSGGERRTIIPIAEIPSSLKNAVISIEDQNFYNESAISFRGILRALWVDITRKSAVQGASTITQQLARSAFLTSDVTVIRKLKELLLAIRINSHYTKDQVLELYLNEVPYGPNIYGAETASQAFFGKRVSDLTLSESAILAATIKAPSYYSPWGSHTKELFSRQKIVLKKMKDLGKITDAEYSEAVNQNVHFLAQNASIRAPHFVFSVQDYLIKKYGEDMVMTGGLKVITTLDIRLQEAAEKAVSEGAERNAKLYGGKNAALVAEDPRTGQILAMVGSKDFFDRENDGNFNVATQGLRQPGSAMKPFVYLKAFEKGYTPDTVLFDLPTEFVPNNPNCPEIPNYSAPSNSRCFHPQNFEKSFEGPVSLRNALAQSMNIPAVKLLYLVGMKDALKTLSDFGVTTLSDPSRYGLSLVLGGGEIKLADLTGAYSVLAADGVKHDQQMVLEVRDSKGNILEQYQDHASEVFDPQYVREINDVLSDANARAPLYSASLGLTTFPGREVAMKTGTTNDYHDAWTFGYTPSLTVGVWAGNNDNVAMQRHGSSILAALPIWNAFMKEALTTYPPEAFERATLPNPAKPILRGDYLADYQIHSILYFVDRSDPTGPAPLNPEDDSQFRYWENGVQRWAAANLPNYALYNSGNPFNNPSSTTPGSINVSITNPVRGSYVNQNQVNVTGLITSPQGLSAVRVYVNGAVVGQFPGQYPSQYSFDYTVSIPELRSQNLLEVEGVGTDNQISKSGVVIYQGNTTAGSTP